MQHVPEHADWANRHFPDLHERDHAWARLWLVMCAGSFDSFLNMQIGLIIILQICMVLFCGIASYIWRKNAGQLRPHLGLSAYTEGNYKNGFVYTVVLMITYWILYSYLVPISLFVTLEIVKFWQAFIFINFDKAIRDPVTGEASRARNSGLNEDLGRVEYVFSDKTAR